MVGDSDLVVMYLESKGSERVGKSLTIISTSGKARPFFHIAKCGRSDQSTTVLQKRFTKIRHPGFSPGAMQFLYAIAT